MGPENIASTYWRANISLVVKLLAIWFAVSFGAGIIFAAPLNSFHLFGFPLGFWFAQQGSIYVFVALIFVYVAKMTKLERSLGLSDQDVSDSHDILDGDHGEGG
jgi:putative solute:sodium symporter small subunit